MNIAPRRRVEFGARRPANGGFILVETIVTMAISAFLLVALAMLISFVAQSFDRTAAAGNDLEVESRFLASISRDLRMVQPASFAGEGIRFAFRGTPTRILYAAPSAGEPGTLQLVDLDATGGTLVQRAGTLIPNASDFETVVFGAPTGIYTGRLRVRFGYYGTVGQGVETLADDWPAGDKMPVAIQVSLLDENGRLIGPGLRVPIHVDAEPGCADPNEKTCSYSKDQVAETLPSDNPGEKATPVDPNDSAGWSRYAR